MTQNEHVRYIQNSLSVFFPRQATIRRKANEFEDILKHDYVQPQILPIPDELDPGMPRIIFDSHRGYSQLIVSQINLVLNVSYSPDWQEDPKKAKEYLMQRLPLLFRLLNTVDDVKPSFCGLATKAHLTFREDDRSTLSHLANTYLSDKNIIDLHDLHIKKTKVISGKFFSNITISNFRGWQITDSMSTLTRLSKSDATEFGIEISGDFNDRYSYNEEKGYVCKEDTAREIIDQGFSYILETVNELLET